MTYLRTIGNRSQRVEMANMTMTACGRHQRSRATRNPPAADNVQRQGQLQQ